MKKLFLILTAAALSFAGCKSVSPAAENSSTTAISIEGDWQTSKLEIDSVEQELCPSEMSIKQNDEPLTFTSPKNLFTPESPLIE